MCKNEEMFSYDLALEFSDFEKIGINGQICN